VEDIFEAAGSALPSNIQQRLDAEKSNQVPSPFSAIWSFFVYLQVFAYPLLGSYLMLKVGGQNSKSDSKHSNKKKKNKKNIVFSFFQSLLGMGRSNGSALSKQDVQDVHNLGSLSVSG
jgi:hypothetical protein